MSGIRAWLDSLGLVEYADAFEREKVTMANLPAVTDADLRELGVPLGPRKTILAAAIPKEAAVTSGDRNDMRKSEERAERRQLTVMFCDLVGSTQLSQKLDPEELRKLIRQYQDACAGAVARFEGHIAQFLGDGVLVYFGYPTAHEDEAGRAIRAALSIVDRVGEVSGDHQLQVRIGIDTGLVVIGHGEKLNEQERTAIGDAPNVAARLQGLAKPGTIVSSDRARQIAGRGFEYVDLGTYELKGIDEPIRAWQVAGEIQAETRFDAATGGMAAPMVGREMELDVAMQTWERAKGGKLQTLLLCGEPGIGKSRILRALRERVSEAGAEVWQYQCSAFFTNTALYPVTSNLGRAISFAPGDSADTRLSKLESFLLGRLNAPELDIQLIGKLLDLPIELKYGELGLNPQRQKEETLRALVDLADNASKQRPVVILFEDAHWADPTSIELIDQFQSRADMRALVVITYRPEFSPSWVGQQHVTQVTLNRLDREQTNQVASHAAGNRTLPAPLIDQIAEKTDGVPLYIEELTKAIIETDVVDRTENGYVLTGPLTSLAIPATLHDSLMARLDRLTSTKEIAQVGACIGREFSHELLSLVSTHTAPDLDDAIDQLLASELVFKRGVGDNAIYTFKHALIQDAAHESLLKSKRAEIHAKLGRILEEHDPRAKESAPELLAFHFAQAGQYEQAITYYEAAGQRSLTRTTVSEAASNFRRVLELAALQPETIERDRIEIRNRIALAAAYMGLHGWTAPEIDELLPRAAELAATHGDSDSLLAAQSLMATCKLTSGESQITLRIGEDLKKTGEAIANPRVEMAGSMFSTMASHVRGLHKDAVGHAEAVSHLYQADRDVDLVATLNHDPICWTNWASSCAYWILGRYRDALEASQVQLDLARALASPWNLAWSLTGSCDVLSFIGNTSRHLELISEARALGEKHDLVFVENMCIFHEGLCKLAAKDFEPGEKVMRQAAEIWDSLGGATELTQAYTRLAEATTALGRYDDSVADVTKANEFMLRNGERYWEPEIYRVRGEIEVSRPKGNLKSAEVDFHKALDTARAREARTFELRAATSLAKLWHRQGKTSAARDLLRPVHHWFREEIETPDVKEAKALLDKLGHVA